MQTYLCKQDKSETNEAGKETIGEYTKSKKHYFKILRVRSLVDRDLRLETNGS